MEATKNPKTDAQRDQHLAVCRHTHDNIIFNYGSVENYIAAKNTEINTAESKLQSYYDNPRKGKSRRAAIIAGLENTIFIMKNSFTNTLRDLEELDAATPTETSQISTGTSEMVNVSMERKNAAEAKRMTAIIEPYKDTDKYAHTPHYSELLGAVCLIFGISREEARERYGLFTYRQWYHLLTSATDATREPPQSPERKIKYFHYTPEQLKRYIIDVYDKRANGEWVLHHQEDTDSGNIDVIDDKVIWWHNKSANSFSYANMDFNSPTCGRCFRINRTYQKDNFIVSDEKLLEFTINSNYYYIQRQTYSKGTHRWCYTIMDAHGDFAVDDFSYTKRGIMRRFNKQWKKNATIVWRSPEIGPHSSEAPQTVECATKPTR